MSIRIEEANGLLQDRDWRVRLRLAERLPVTLLGTLLDDPDPDVRAMAPSRATAGEASDYLPQYTTDSTGQDDDSDRP